MGLKSNDFWWWLQHTMWMISFPPVGLEPRKKEENICSFRSKHERVYRKLWGGPSMNILNKTRVNVDEEMLHGK